MSDTANEIRPIFDKACAIVTGRERLYGDSWKKIGFDGCFQQVLRKAEYLRVQKQNGVTDTEKFDEDLLDLMAWAALTFRHKEIASVK